MELNSDIKFIDGKPLAYIKSISALVCSDLHLGYEDMMASKGIFIPQINLKTILKQITETISLVNPKLLIINGDVKNEFSSTSIPEFNELNEFFNVVKKTDVKIILIKGNHDNYFDKYKDPFGVETYNEEFLISEYLFFHGEALPTNNYKKISTLIMGHEHPSIKITKNSGGVERLKCFLYGDYKNKKLLVLPAISYFASGSPINTMRKLDLISPIFNYVDIDDMDAIALGYGETINFGPIKLLRNM